MYDIDKSIFWYGVLVYTCPNNDFYYGNFKLPGVFLLFIGTCTFNDFFYSLKAIMTSNSVYMPIVLGEM